MTEILLSGWIDRVRAAEKSGDLFVAYDLAMQGLTEHPNSVDLRYLATRVLARSGATNHAAAMYERFRLGRQRNTDIASLGARITKDVALAAATGKRKALRIAAAAYGRIFAHTPAPYPGVNAATLYLLAGDSERARSYARRTLDASNTGSSRTSVDRYYRLASRAEAAVILGDIDLARGSLREAARQLGTDYDAAATTCRQLRLVCRITGTSPDILDIIRPPAVLHYCGPALTRSGFSLDRQYERDVLDKITAHIAHRKIGFAYGSLSAGGEILCAEACLRAGAELNVVLPFDQDE